MGVRETKPFGVRMSEDIKEALSREAKINGRSLNQEIVARLKVSLSGSGTAAPGSGYTLQSPKIGGYTSDLNEAERQMLVTFRKFTPEKQLALLSLFR